tara:strand:- start:622 stop:834 length:213 start_codon:yes stop_codon:yes gene_type:complete
MPKFLIKVRHGITTGTSTKTATVEANDKDHAYRMLMADGNVGPFMDWEEDFDVEYDASPEYLIKEAVNVD